jgi:hypothetical protein
LLNVTPTAEGYAASAEIGVDLDTITAAKFSPILSPYVVA